MNQIAEDILMHYGVEKRSGRYPWGSGENPYQHSEDFLSRVEDLEKRGKNQKEIAQEFHTSTTRLRVQIQLAKHERRAVLVDKIHSMQDDGKTVSEIARELGYANESSVRSLLNENTSFEKKKAKATAEVLKKEVDKKKMVDVGEGVELEAGIGVSKAKFQEALMILESEGYNIYGIGVPQVTNPGKQTTVRVLCAPEVTYAEAYQNRGNIQPFADYHTNDNGKTWDQIQYPASIDSGRVAIRYADEGGLAKDGVIEIRRGVKDLDLGNSHYAQVRILVDGTHYLKGMAMYSDDIPDGADIVFNTNKKSDVPKMSVLKPIGKDPDNPFGALIKANGQSQYTGDDGGKHLSVINKIKEEGDWDDMDRTLSSQFLSKQPMSLINKQLRLTYSDAEDEFAEIDSLTNPTIKRKLLYEFARKCDSAAVHLKAAALPRQRTQVILPIEKMRDDEVYAANYENGEKVALIRYPHGGTFEIPILTVNNRNSTARGILGNALDAVGISSKVAERLSGADFDGDTVTVIPLSDKVRVKSTHALTGLENFNAKEEYAVPEGNPNHVKLMSKEETGKQMGVISNLITDMTLRSATEEELTRAVKHSMVVIDAQKHGLDYKKSERDNGIAELKKKYQVHIDEDGNVKYGGASTLISARKQDVRVPERKGSVHIDPETGELIYKESGRYYDDLKKLKDPETGKPLRNPETGKILREPTGKKVQATTTVSLMSITDDAYKLSSGTAQENAYADYANKMKALANRARLGSLTQNAGKLQYDKSAKQTYRQEVAQLEAKLNIAARNAPKERAAQILANDEINEKQRDNQEMTSKELKKAAQLAILKSRRYVDASGKDTRIEITDREWEAIQAGAISDTKLSRILRYADTDKLRQRALPRTTTELSQAKRNRIKSMVASGYNNAEIAKQLGISAATVAKYSREPATPPSSEES